MIFQIKYNFQKRRMSCTFVCQDGKTFQIKNKNQSVRRLKRKVARELNVAIGTISLFFDGVELSDENAIMCFDNAENPIIAVTLGPIAIKLTLRTLTGKSTILNCESTTLIRELLNKYHEIEGVPPEMVILINKSQRMFGGDITGSDYDKPLKFYGITSDTTITAYLNLRGD